MHVVVLTRIDVAHGLGGGMEIHTQAVAQGLVSRGHQVRIVTTVLPKGRPVEPAVPTDCLPSAPPGRYSNAWFTASAAHVAELHHQQSIDLIWSQSSGGLGYLLRERMRLGIPCVVTLHGTLHSEWATRLRNARSVRGFLRLVYFLPMALEHRQLWQRAVPLVDQFIAVSQFVADDALQTMGIPPERVAVIPNGVDTVRFAPDPERRRTAGKQLDLPEQAMVVIAVSRLEQEKGLHLAIEALARLGRSNVRLIIVGKGRDESRLRRLAEHAGLVERVHFVGFVPNEDLPSYLNVADIFLMPTLCYEAFPMSIVEAMACGLAIVATDVGGIPTAIDDGRNGLLFPVGNVEALAAQVRRLLEEPGLARVLGKAARAKAVKCFSVERMVRDTEAVFQQVVERAKRQ